jgi:hypothetical protein
MRIKLLKEIKICSIIRINSKPLNWFHKEKKSSLELINKYKDWLQVILMMLIHLNGRNFFLYN